jgi:RNA polymerase sigma-70 factor (ECF subfamily)
MLTTAVSLLDRLREPDSDAWARFVYLYTPLLQHWAERLGLQDADAADLVQDTLGILVRELPRFAYDPAQSFRGWLRTVQANCWRARPRRGTVPLGVEPPGSNPADEAEEEEYRGYLVNRALKIMQTDFEAST